jgi:hypothetical protein
MVPMCARIDIFGQRLAWYHRASSSFQLLFLPPKTATQLSFSQPAIPLDAVIYVSSSVKHFNMDGISHVICPKVIHGMGLAAQQVLVPL